MCSGRLIVVAIMTTVLALMSGVAQAEWCGENGVVRLSFTQEGELQSVATATPNETGLTMVDLYVFLDDVDPVEHAGERFLNVGGFELKLKIEGSEASILEQGFPEKIMNVGPETGWCLVGIDGGAQIKDGRAYLMRWKIAFPGKPENVVFSLDPAGVVSCHQIPECSESGIQALYVGTLPSKQAGLLVGAGCVPAYLNWDGEPDLTPIHSKVSWTELGVLKKP